MVLFNINYFWPIDRPLKYTTILRKELGLMVTKEYFTPSRTQKICPHYQMNFSDIPRTSPFLSNRMRKLFSTRYWNEDFWLWNLYLYYATWWQLFRCRWMWTDHVQRKQLVCELVMKRSHTCTGNRLWASRDKGRLINAVSHIDKTEICKLKVIGEN